MQPESLIALLMIIFFTGIVVWVMVAARRVRKETLQRRQQIASALGLEPLAAPDPEVLEAVRHLYQRMGYAHSYRVTFAFRQPRAEANLYWLEVITEDDDDSATASGPGFTVLAIDPGISLPDFLLYPKPYGGAVARTASRLMSLLMERIVERFTALRVVNLRSLPQYDDHFLLLAADEEAARLTFTAPVLGRLTQAEHCSIQGGGKYLSVTRYFVGRVRKESAEEIKALLDETAGIVNALRNFSLA